MEFELITIGLDLAVSALAVSTRGALV